MSDEALQSPYQPYRSQLLSSARVRELTQLRPERVLRDTCLAWIWILAAFALVALWTTPWAVLVAIPVIGSRYYALFIIGHDAMHRRLFPSQRLNDRFCDLLVFGPIGAVTSLNNRNHLAHHRLLATPQDPDRHKHATYNKRTLAALLGFASGLASLRSSLTNVFLRDPDENTRGREYRATDVLILVGWQVVLIVALTSAIGWWAWPVLWLLPVYAFTFVTDNLRSFAEHSHPELDEQADTHRLITFVSSPVERLLFAPMNMNYHTVHHLWPAIPYYNLPMADAEIRARGEQMGLEWRGSYFGHLWRYARALPL